MSADPVERLIDQAIAQGLPRHVDDGATLTRVARLLQGEGGPKAARTEFSDRQEGGRRGPS